MNNTATAAGVKAFGEMSVQDYIAVAKRRKFWVIFPALAVMISMAVMAWRLPDTYRSYAIILVEPQKVPYNYFQPTAVAGWNERLAAIYQEVISPARLKRIIDSMGLYPEIRKQEGEQEAISALQKGILIEQVPPMTSQADATKVPAFRLGFKSRNPAQAAQVTNQVAAMFIEENLKIREEASYGTADFIESELQKTSQEMQEKANELAELRSRFGQDLPEAGPFHFQEAEALRRQLQATEQQITQDQQQKVDLQSLAESAAPTIDVDLGAGISTNGSETEELQTKLNALRSRYGPNHPDVRKLQAQMDEAKAKEADTAAKTATPASKTATPAVRKRINPVIEAQLEQVDQDIEKQTKLAAQLKTEINFHLSKAQGAPAFAQKAADVQRDYDALQGRYRDLLNKKMAAETATAMESREKSERFVLLDSAPVPERPYAPNRPLLIICGIPFGILVGIGAALAGEALDDSVRSEREAERILGTSVLSGVPEILTVQQLWHSTLRLCAVAAVMIVVAVGLGFEIAHLSVRFL